MLVLYDTRRLIKKRAPVLGLVGEDPVDLSLSDNGVTLLADSGIIKKFIHVAQAADCPVEEIFTLTAPVNTAGDSHLPVIDGERAVSIIQRYGNISKAKRPARLCPREDDILHRRPAQLLDSLLSKHPPDRVRHIALSAAVRSHDSGDAIVEFKFNLVCKGLKALNFNTL